MSAETLLVRTAESRDLSAVDALLARSYPALLKADYAPSILVTAVPLLARAQPRLLASGTYFVVEAEGRVVGAGGWTCAAPSASTGNVRHVVTDHRRTRRGIGRALMEHVVATAGAAGLTRLDCLATRTAVPFYAACGFAALGPCEIALAAGISFPAVRMQRRL